MNSIMNFTYENKVVRTLASDGTNWWIAKDVCTILEVGNITDAMSRLDEDEKAVFDLIEVSSNGTKQKRKCMAVNEPGLYSLILSSRKPEAKAFKRWITHEVLPAIRRDGAYQQPVNNAQPNPQTPKLPATYIEALEELLESKRSESKLLDQKAQLEKVNAKLLPKADFADSFIDNKGTAKLGDWIKTIPTDLGPIQIFKWMRQKRILFSRRKGENEPFNQLIQRGYFIMKQTSFRVGEDEHIGRTTYITIKGQMWLLDLLRIDGQLKSYQGIITFPGGKNKALSN